MSSHDDVPYADTESLSDLVGECLCVEGECAAHGVGLHPSHRPDVAGHPAPLEIGEATGHIVDGYPDYGS